MVGACINSALSLPILNHARNKENCQIIDRILCKRTNLSSEQISTFDTTLLLSNQRRHHRG